MQDMVPEYDKLWDDDKAIENIFSVTNFVNKYRFTDDWHQDDDFNIHTNIEIIKLRRNKQGLYVFKHTYTIKKCNVFTIMEENMVGLTIRKIERAKLGSKIYSNLGLPTVKDFKHMVSTNTILKCSILVADISNYEKIYGTSLSSHKG